MEFFQSKKNKQKKQAQQQEQSQQAQQQEPNFGTCGGSGGRRIPCKAYDASKPTSAVIVTVFSQASYDDLFRRVDQESPSSDVSVSLFELHYEDLPAMLGALRREPSGSATPGIVDDIAREVGEVDRDSVVFNFECCGACSSAHMPFPEVTMGLVRELLDRGHIIMFGDFSVKSLITFWDSSLLGPNPFIKVGEFDTSFELGFDPLDLAGSPIAQLRRVAELCGDGRAHVQALGGTVSFTVDPAKADTDAYRLQVLSVCTKQHRFVPPPNIPVCRTGRHEGMAGHVALVFPSGGQIVASCGHWIELSRLDVNLERVLNAATNQYGTAFANDLGSRIRSSAPAMQEQMMQSFAQQYVQSAAPCNYSGSSKK